jgi:hypothetical protein
MFLSCGKRSTKIDYENQIKEDTLKIENLVNDTTKTLVADLPVLFDSVEFLFHPIGLIDLNDRESKGLFKSGSFSNSSYSGSEFGVSSSDEDYISGDMTNIVFESTKTNEQRLLTSNIIKIQTFKYLRDIYTRVKRQYLLYTIIDKDSNYDKELNYYDIESLYISNIDGTDFKKLTKNEHDYFSGELLKEELKYYYKTIEDVNHDGEFDKHDQFHYYYLDFSSDPIKVIEYNPLRLIIK